MDKNVIKKYAIWARRELIEKVTQKSLQYGIEEGVETDPNAESVNGILLTDTEKKQRQALIRKVKNEGFRQAMEEVAYTWFNRFIALRFMEVNGYLPSHVRVFTDDNNEFKPQILTEALHLQMDGLDLNKVLELKSLSENEELFKYLLIVQCNDLNSILPEMFQKISDYTELLLPDYLLRQGSVIERLVIEIPKEDWEDQVQIIGWLYQYYNTEKKDEVFNALKKNVKITKENIPAATQLFTPDWIVRYMVENSLAYEYREELKDDLSWDYFMDNPEQLPQVQKTIEELHENTKNIEQIKCIDPSCGSGHVLVYMFEVLIKIYQAKGFEISDAIRLILQNNLYGLDIDDRAAQLANFSIMMKARQYDRRFFRRNIHPNVYAIVDSNEIDGAFIEYFHGDNEAIKNSIKSLMDEMRDAKEYGSLLKISSYDWEALFRRADDIKNEISLFSGAINPLCKLLKVASILDMKYDVVITNPPYMGSTGMSAKLTKYVKQHFSNEASDLYACFIKHYLDKTTRDGFLAMITMEGWLFQTSFESMRREILNGNVIRNLVHMPYLGKGGTSLGINFGTAAFVIRKTKILNYKSQNCYIRYFEIDENGIPLEFPTINERYKTSNSDDFVKIPGSPVSYWIDESIYNLFTSYKPISHYGKPLQGTITGDNTRFLRLWSEVDINKVAISEDRISECKWILHNKGGDRRKWYGNISYVMNWENDGFEIRNFFDDKGKLRSRPQNIDSFFKTGVTWSDLTSGKFSARYQLPICSFDATGPTMICTNIDPDYVLGFFNTALFQELLDICCPGLHYNNGIIAKLPLVYDEKKSDEIIRRAKENRLLAIEEWNEYEESWGFEKNPLIPQKYEDIKIEDVFKEREDYTKRRRAKIAENETAINEMINAVAGVTTINSVVTPDEVTIRVADRKEDIIRLISYAVGCMFGRYSLDEPGVVFAGGTFQADKYLLFPADKDNIIPICDDEYFEDDIVNRFICFIKTVYGEKYLEENLRYIADSIGGIGQSREIIRNYFLSDYYRDHCSIFSVTGSGKRPIYWQFDSGKKNGFKCLIYMHRYQPDTIARIRTDYVHEQQARYRTAIEHLDEQINNTSGATKVKFSKKLKSLKDQAEELHNYEEKVHHLADQMISINLDDGVKNNYEIFKDVLAKLK